jgi:hypothetical protein
MPVPFFDLRPVPIPINNHYFLNLNQKKVLIVLLVVGLLEVLIELFVDEAAVERDCAESEPCVIVAD